MHLVLVTLLKVLPYHRFCLNVNPQNKSAFAIQYFFSFVAQFTKLKICLLLFFIMTFKKHNIDISSYSSYCIRNTKIYPLTAIAMILIYSMYSIVYFVVGGPDRGEI